MAAPPACVVAAGQAGDRETETPVEAELGAEAAGLLEPPPPPPPPQGDLDRQPLPPAGRRRSRRRPLPPLGPRGSGGVVCVGTDAESSRRAVELAARAVGKARPGSGGTGGRRGDHSRAHARPRRRLAGGALGNGRAASRTTPRRAWAGSPSSSTSWPAGTVDSERHVSSPSASAGSTTTTTTRRATSSGTSSPPRSPCARHRLRARDPHAGGLGRHVLDPRARGHARPDDLPLLHRRRRRRRSGASTSAPTSPSAGSSRSRTPTSCARRSRTAPSTACCRDRLALPHAGALSRPAERAAYVALVGECARRRSKGFEPEVLAAVSWMNAEKVFGLGN